MNLSASGRSATAIRTKNSGISVASTEKSWEKYAERGTKHKHQHTQGHRQLHMAARFLFLEFERGLDSQSHEKKIQHRDAAAEQISEQHCVVPFADDQKYYTYIY